MHNAGSKNIVRLVIVGLFIVTLTNGQSLTSDTILIQDLDFEILYSQVLEQPLVVEYDVKCPSSGVSRSGMGFYGTKVLVTSDYRDYSDNIYDKGHCIPAASFDCNETLLRKTFSYINCALQHEKLNRTTWKYLEEFERELAESEKVHVRIIIDFNTIRRLPSNAAVPTGFYKEISTSKRRLCFFFPNDQPISKDIMDYKCPCRSNINIQESFPVVFFSTFN
jgi:DNA/RNA endonuclease G (NUC1)